jgi:phage shock protein A
MTTKKGGSFKDTDQAVRTEELPKSIIKAVNEIYNKMNLATEPLREANKVWGKPLPQILDEMDDNIRAAAQAAKKAEEAARAAKQAAGDAHRASTEAERRAEEALLAGIKAAEIATKEAKKAIAQFKKTAQDINATKASMQQRIESLERKLQKFEEANPMYGKEFETENLDRLLSLTETTDPVLAVVWNNPKDAAYDKL